MELVDLVAECPDRSVTELATAAGVAKSTASRTCSVLVEGGYLERNDAGRFVLGPRLIELGNLSRLRRGLSSKLVASLTELRNRVQETVQLAVVHDGVVSYVERIDADSGLRFSAERYRSSTHPHLSVRKGPGRVGHRVTGSDCC